MSRSQLTSTVEQNTGGAVSPYVAGKNKIINGDFGIWQRDTSFSNPTSTASSYIADRWNAYRSGFTAGITTTRQSSGLTGFQYNVRVQRNSGDTSTAVLTLQQSLETATSVPLANQSVTISFYARAGANYSATSNQLSFIVTTGTGTDQSNVGGYTGSATPISSTATLTTSWQRFSATASLSSATNEISVGFFANPVGTAGVNDYFEVTGVQLEAGSVATPFTTATGTLSGELVACQRYYWRLNGSDVSGSTIANICNGYVESSTVITGIYNFPIQMRIPPSIAGGASTNFIALGGGSFHYPATLSTQAISKINARISLTQTSLTAYQAGALLMSYNATDYLEHSAEL